jgi:hypothetical protein
LIFRRRGCSGYERRLERGAALGDGKEAADILDVDKIRGFADIMVASGKWGKGAGEALCVIVAGITFCCVELVILMLCRTLKHTLTLSCISRYFCFTSR